MCTQGQQRGAKSQPASGVIFLGTEQRAGTTVILCVYFNCLVIFRVNPCLVFFFFPPPPQSIEKSRVCWERVSLTSWLASMGKAGRCWQRHRQRLAVFFLASAHKYYEEKWESGFSTILDLEII